MRAIPCICALLVTSAAFGQQPTKWTNLGIIGGQKVAIDSASLRIVTPLGTRHVDYSETGSGIFGGPVETEYHHFDVNCDLITTRLAGPGGIGVVEANLDAYLCGLSESSFTKVTADQFDALVDATDKVWKAESDRINAQQAAEAARQAAEQNERDYASCRKILLRGEGWNLLLYKEQRPSPAFRNESSPCGRLSQEQQRQIGSDPEIVAAGAKAATAAAKRAASEQRARASRVAYESCLTVVSPDRAAMAECANPEYSYQVCVKAWGPSSCEKPQGPSQILQEGNVQTGPASETAVATSATDEQVQTPQASFPPLMNREAAVQETPVADRVGEATETIAVSGRSNPWSQSANPSMQYSRDAFPPVVWALSEHAVPVGSSVTIRCVGGTTNAGGIPDTGCDGVKGMFPPNNASFQPACGEYYPSKYEDPSMYPTWTFQVMAVFARADGVVVGKPFPISAVAITVKVPPRATQLQFGMNDCRNSDNSPDPLMIQLSFAPMRSARTER